MDKIQKVMTWYFDIIHMSMIGSCGMTYKAYIDIMWFDSIVLSIFIQVIMRPKQLYVIWYIDMLLESFATMNGFHGISYITINTTCFQYIWGLTFYESRHSPEMYADNFFLMYEQSYSRLVSFWKRSCIYFRMVNDPH